MNCKQHPSNMRVAEKRVDGGCAEASGNCPGMLGKIDHPSNPLSQFGMEVYCRPVADFVQLVVEFATMYRGPHDIKRVFQ